MVNGGFRCSEDIFIDMYVGVVSPERRFGGRLITYHDCDDWADFGILMPDIKIDDRIHQMPSCIKDDVWYHHCVFFVCVCVCVCEMYCKRVRCKRDEYWYHHCSSSLDIDCLLYRSWYFNNLRRCIIFHLINSWMPWLMMIVINDLLKRTKTSPIWSWIHLLKKWMVVNGSRCLFGGGGSLSRPPHPSNLRLASKLVNVLWDLLRQESTWGETHLSPLYTDLHQGDPCNQLLDWIPDGQKERERGWDYRERITELLLH